MSKRGRSDIWEHMTKTTSKTVECKLCNKEFAYHGSTSTFSRHLQTAHPLVLNAPKPSSSSTSSSTPSTSKTSQPTLLFGARKFSEARQEKANELLTKFIISNMLPLSLVDDEAFQEFVRFLEPEYKVPCRQTFTARLDSIKTERAKAVKADLASASSVALTTDIWTSVSNEPYISFTCSYITDDWQLVSRTLSNEAIEERHTQVYTAVQNQITVTLKSIILKEKPKTNLLLCIKYGSMYAVDASVNVFVSLYWFQLHTNCFDVCCMFRIKFRTIILLCFGIVLLFTCH